MRKKRYVALTLVFAMVLSMFVGLSTEPVNAATKKYEVPVKVIHYSNEADSNSIDKAKWGYAGSDSFTYNSKGYVTAQGVWRTRWTLSGSRWVKAVSGSKKQRAVGVSTYKNGALTSIAFKQYNSKGSIIGRGTEKYGRTKASKGWIAKISGNKAGTKYTLIHTFKFYSNGMPKAVKETVTAYGDTYVRLFYFNGRGLITKIRTNYGTITFTYKYKNGRPVERYVYDDGFLMYKDKLVYNRKYTSDRKTYVGTINNTAADDVASLVRDALTPAFPCLAK